MSAVRLLTLLLAALVLLPATASAAACPAGKVSVKLGKKTSCQPLAAALPTPAKADARLTLLRSAVAFSWKGARDRRGHRSPTMAKLFRRVSPKARKLLTRNLPRAVRLVPVRATRQAGGCGTSPATTFTEKGKGDLSLSVSVTTSSIEATVENKDKRLDMSFDLCRMTQSIDVPSCPTTDGKLDARSTFKGTVTTSLLEDGRVKQKVSAALDGFTEFKGQTADDAKLDRLDIVDVMEIKISSPGGIFIGDSRVSGFFKRRASVSMRATPPAYTPVDDGTILDASLGGIAGLLVGNEFRRNSTRQLKQAADKMFADVVARAIERYREKETAWQTPETCVETTFDPVSRSVTLRRDQTGSFKAKLKARSDGGAPSGKWTLAGQSNATVSPSTATGNEPSFDYRVLDAGTGKFVTAVVGSTSKAGVGRQTWTQETEAEPPLPTFFAGTYSGTAVYDADELGAGNHMDASFSGNVAVDGAEGQLKLVAGNMQYAFSGHAADCTVHGSGPVDLAAQQDLSGYPALELFAGPPRGYRFQIPMPLMVTIRGQRDQCENPDDNGKDFDWYTGAGIPWLVNAPAPGGPVNPDWSFSGSGSGNNGAGTRTRHGTGT